MRDTRGTSPVGKGLFGRWLAETILACDCTTEVLCKTLRVTRAAVSTHINHRVKPSFPMVVAYCWALGYPDPEEIWKLVEKDWS